MRREQSERPAQPPLDVQGLRAEIAAMSRSLADLAPRNAVVALEGDRKDDLARRMGEDRPHPRLEVEQRCGLVEVAHRVAEYRHVPNRPGHLAYHYIY